MLLISAGDKGVAAIAYLTIPVKHYEYPEIIFLIDQSGAHR